MRNAMFDSRVKIDVDSEKIKIAKTLGCRFCIFVSNGSRGLECRRYPPTNLGNGKGGGNPTRVRVDLTDWCGEFVHDKDGK
jgi:hypothetical protein